MNKNYWLFLCLVVTMAWGFESSAQMTETARKEFSLEEDYGHYVVPFTDLRSALYSYRNTDRKSDVVYWNYEFWNEDLLPVAKKQFEIPKIFDDRTSLKRKDHYYQLFYSKAKGVYEFYEFDINTRSVQHYGGKFIPKMRIYSLQVIDKTVFISAEYKGKHQVIVLDLNSNAYKTYISEEMMGQKVIYNDMQLIEIPEGDEVAFEYKVCDRTSCEHYIKIFTKDGQPRDNFMTVSKPDEDKELKQISISKEGGAYLLTGTFGLKKKGLNVGFFFAKTQNSSYEFVKYYNFLDLQDFTSYMHDKSRRKIERKADKAEEKGEELFVNYNAVIHNVQIVNNEYVLLAEFYYPTYRTEYYTTFVNGKSVTRTRQVFDGYQYSHASVAGFDREGKMLWSNTFEMWLSQKPFSVRRFIRATYEGSKIEMVFVNGVKIKSVTYNRGQVEKTRNISMIETGDENDVVKSSSADISWWYGQNYLISGTQHIKNSDNDIGKKKRRIFFVNKWTY